jgi:hypothetical protein
MHTNKLLLIILMFVPLFSFGTKAPGYLGKKTQIGAYICYMPDYLSLRDGDKNHFLFQVFYTISKFQGWLAIKLI